MKKLWTVLIVLCVFFIANSTFATKEPTIQLNGTEIKTEVAPFIKQDRTFVPLRFVSEALGYEVGWEEATRQVTIQGKDQKLLLTIDSTTMTVNGKEKTIEVAPLIRQERTFVPLRFVAENLGVQVEWDSKNYIVLLTRAETDTLKLTADEGVYFENFNTHQNRIGQLMQELKSYLFENRSKYTTEDLNHHYDRIKRELDEHIASVENLKVPEKFEMAHQLAMDSNRYLQDILPRLKTAILETDENAAKNIVLLMTEFQIKMEEATQALNAALKGEAYRPDKDIQTYNDAKKKQDDTNNLLQDDNIKNLINKLN